MNAERLAWIAMQAMLCRAFVAALLVRRPVKRKAYHHPTPSYRELAGAGLHELGATSSMSTEEVFMYHLFLAEALEADYVRTPEQSCC